MRQPTTASSVALAILLAGCSLVQPSTTTEPLTAPATATAPSPAATPSPTPATTQPDQTVSAEDTIERIRSLAAAGDVDGLAQLALEGDEAFTASLGGGYSNPEELSNYWRSISDPDVQEIILGLLDAGSFEGAIATASGQEVGLTIFPAAFGDGSTDADRVTLESIFGTETVASWYAETAYVGWRLGIDDDGIWRLLVAGD